MTTLTGPFSQHVVTSDNGLLFVDVDIAVGTGARIALERDGRIASTASIRVRAMIDTGADRSLVDPGILAQLGELPTSAIVELTGVGTPKDSDVVARMHEIALRMPDGGMFPSLEIVARDLSHVGADMFIGADVLAHCVAILNGPAQTFRLKTVNPPPCIRADRTGATTVDNLEAVR